MPVALRAESEEERLLVSESSWERSRPRVFLMAVLEVLGVARAEDSSAARRASFSAFLRAASCFLCSASSLNCVKNGGISWGRTKTSQLLRLLGG